MSEPKEVHPVVFDAGSTAKRSPGDFRPQPVRADTPDEDVVGPKAVESVTENVDLTQTQPPLTEEPSTLPVELGVNSDESAPSLKLPVLTKTSPGATEQRAKGLHPSTPAKEICSSPVVENPQSTPS